MSNADTVVENASVCDLFVEKAGVAAAIVSRIKRFDDAVAYAVKLCMEKDLCRYAIDDTGVNLEGVTKTLAAPGLSDAEFSLLTDTCTDQKINCIDGDMRNYLAGVDVGFSYADIGLAETGTIVLNCPDEELRLATMLCEHHVCILPASKIVADAFAAEKQLTAFMLDSPTYTAFITGPSRTADIERVLSIGVHGPLELHILILED